jgi:hypothetical protein
VNFLERSPRNSSARSGHARKKGVKAENILVESSIEDGFKGGAALRFALTNGVILRCLDALSWRKCSAIWAK